MAPKKASTHSASGEPSAINGLVFEARAWRDRVWGVVMSRGNNVMFSLRSPSSAVGG